MHIFCGIKKAIDIFHKYSWKDIYGRTKEIIRVSLCHSKKLKKLHVEENGALCNSISVVAIAKNEAVYIKEWIEYHLLLGVEHFYIYDNESKDNLHSILKSYIDHGIVSYIYCPGSTMQIQAYNDAIVRFKKRNRWMAFIDIDEFIVINPKFPTNILDFLKTYEKYDMLGINWCVFDSNNHEYRPQEGFVISNYIRCHANDNDPANRHIKCIVKPSSVKLCTNPHYMHLKANRKAVDENFNKLTIPFSSNVSIKKIQINHYFSKSKEEYMAKISRGRATISKKRSFNPIACDFSYGGGATKQGNPNLSSFVEILKTKISETYK